MDAQEIRALSDAVHLYWQVVSRAGVETSGYYYPKEGDRIICLNYVSFRPPTNWLGEAGPKPFRVRSL